MTSKDDAKERRRMKDRIRKQRYTKNNAEEFKQLREEIARLWRQYDMIQRAKEQKSMKMLPWHTVSDALKEAAVDSALENSSLKRHVACKRRLIQELERWVHQFYQPNNILPKSCQETWRNSYLPSSSESRQLGMKWIIQHMYHQTERMLEVERFFDRGSDVSVNFSDGVAEVGVHCDSVLHCSVELASDILWFEMYVRLGAHEIDLCYKQARPVSNPTPDRTPVLMNAIFGRFSTRERIVIVSRAIVDDETRPWKEDEYNYNLLYWIILEPIAHNQTRWRAYSRICHPYNPARGYMSLDQYARLRGLDTSKPYEKQLREFLVDKRRDSLNKFLGTVALRALSP